MPLVFAAPEDEPGCRSNDDCPLSDTCLNRRCVNPCVASSPCATNADCVPVNHRAQCRCPAPLVGDPLVNCYALSAAAPECESDSACPSDRACINQRCQEPCAVTNPCGVAADCRTFDHRPICSCPDGWGGNPQIQCYRPQCKADTDCVYDKACIEGNCLNPCVHGAVQCGRGAECLVQAHRAQCVCPAGTQGDPFLSCVAGVCQYNEDCADHEACDRLNRVCRPVCDDETCAVTATCAGRRHQAVCSCPPGTNGNPYIECLGGCTV
ncbi:hypothetical protein FOCC_FOCC007730, partial [Frankliniella occidentalis]